jgi:hypothetical protein
LIVEDTRCQAHSGVNAKVDGVIRWQEHHDEVVHVRVDKNLEDIAKRLPFWATFVMSGMGTVIGYLVALVKFSTQGG